MATSKVLKPRRGSTAEHATFKGQAFEITFDTDKKTVVAHDGLTMGGFPLAHEAAVSETDKALRALIDQKVSEVGGVSSSELRALESALRGLINSNAQQQVVRDTDQDNVISVLAQEVAKKLSLSGGVMSGALSFSGPDCLFRTTQDEYMLISGGLGWDDAYIQLDGKNTDGVAFLASANKDGGRTLLRVWPGGAVDINGRAVVCTVNGVDANVSGDIIEPGWIIPFAGSSIPAGRYLLCNGAAVARNTYADLFAAIGTIYGAGDGLTTFNLPDMNGRVIQGANGDPLYITAGLPNMLGDAGDILWNTHVPVNTNGALYYTGLGAGQWAYIGKGDIWSGTARLIVDASFSNPIYGASATVQPPALALRYYIKY